MEHSYPEFFDQFLEDPDLFDKLLKEYGPKIPELAFLPEIEDPWERKDKFRGLIEGEDPSWYWKVVNSRYPSVSVSVVGTIPDLILPSPRPDGGSDSDVFPAWPDIPPSVYKELERKVIPAVGSLERAGNNDFIGTGWLVGEQMVITNRHVLTKEQLAWIRDDGEIIYEEGTVRFDLRNGPKEGKQNEFTVTEVLYLATDDGPDVALLRVVNESSGGDSLPAPLTLYQEDPIFWQMVLAVGYPGYDLDDICKDYYEGKLEQIFPDSVLPNGQLNPKMFNVKRMSVGYLAEVTDSRLYHFCNTTGGSSGSAIINLDGQVVGLHYGGDCDDQRNFAVPAAVIRQIVDRLT